MGFATQYGNLPEGSKASSVEALDGGGYAITVTNADGSKGVVTEDGSSDPSSAIVQFQPGQLGRLANTKFEMEIVNNTSRFNPDHMNQLSNLIDADSGVQGLRDDEIDFQEDQRLKKSVIQAAEKTGNVALVRGVESAIADGDMETTRAIAEDLGVSMPEETVTKTSETIDDSGSTDATDPREKPSVAPFDMKTVDRNSKAGRLILSIEGNVANNPRAPVPQPWQQKQQRPKLKEYREKLATRIATTEKNRAGNSLEIPLEKDGLVKDKAELAMIDGYLEEDKTTVFSTDLDPVAKQIEGKSGPEIEQGVNNGTIVVDKQTQALVAAQLQREGIRELRDLRRLKSKDAAIARAVIISSSQDINIRKQMATEMVNILDGIEGSPSVSRKDELSQVSSARTNAYRVAKLRADIGKTKRAWNTDANKQAADVLAGVQDIVFGKDRDEENFNFDAATQILRGKPFNTFSVWMKQTDRTDEEIANAMPGMSATLSLTIGALAGDQSGGNGIWDGFRESMIDFMGRDEVGEAVDPADFDASRLRVDDSAIDENGNYKATKIYYTDEDGNILDEEAGMSTLKSLHPEMYNNAMEIAVHNTRKAMGG